VSKGFISVCHLDYFDDIHSCVASAMSIDDEEWPATPPSRQRWISFVIFVYIFV